MRFATIVVDGSLTAVVEAADGGLIPLDTIDPAFSSLRRLIELGEDALRGIKTALGHAPGTISAESAVWAPPLPNPSKMLYLALNNRGIDKGLSYRPDFPVYWPKFPSALIGHGQTVEISEHYGLTHPEPELGVIVGRRARNISLDAAMDVIFGYTVLNDITSVGMRKEDYFSGRYPMPNATGGYQWIDEYFVYQGRYKNCDGFGPMGPFVVHKDDVPDPMNIEVRAWLDDEEVSHDNTCNLHFSVAEVIHWMSAHHTLLPGDVISMGTAVHPDEKARPLSYADINRWGDRLRVEFKGVGILDTKVKRLRGQDDPRAHFAATKSFIPGVGPGAHGGE